MAGSVQPLIFLPPARLRTGDVPDQVQRQLLPGQLHHDPAVRPLPRPPVAPCLYDCLHPRLHRLVLPLLGPRRRRWARGGSRQESRRQNADLWVRDCDGGGVGDDGCGSECAGGSDRWGGDCGDSRRV
ncbi:hypothetical protein LINGRAPRIM_LOCUS3371 [Linum grandiflorum]